MDIHLRMQTALPWTMIFVSKTRPEQPTVVKGRSFKDTLIDEDNEIILYYCIVTLNIKVVRWEGFD